MNCKYYHSTVRRIPRCSACNGTGHNKSGCPKLYACGPCGEPFWRCENRPTRAYDVAHREGWNDAVDAWQEYIRKALESKEAIKEVIEGVVKTEEEIIYKAPASMYPIWHEKNPKNTKEESE